MMLNSLTRNLPKDYRESTCVVKKNKGGSKLNEEEFIIKRKEFIYMVDYRRDSFSFL